MFICECQLNDSIECATNQHSDYLYCPCLCHSMENKPTPNYQQFVSQLKKSGESILLQQTAHKCDLEHMAIGVSSDAGELLDCVKKHTIYNQPLNIYGEHGIVEELGDIEFFLEGLRQALSITREAIIAANIVKLQARYDKLTYTDEDAAARKDKNVPN